MRYQLCSWRMRMFGAMAAALMLLLGAGCVGGRVGARHVFAGDERGGVYGGPVASLGMYPASVNLFGGGDRDGYAIPTLDLGYMLAPAHTGFALVSPEIWFVADTGMSDGVMGMSIGLGIEFGSRWALNVSACGFASAVIATGQACGRLSSAGWLGGDVGVLVPAGWFAMAM